MERLSGVGAVFLAVETATNPMHVATLAVLDPSAAPGFGLAAVRCLIEARLHLLAPLRRRVVEVPFGLGRPVAVDDPHFVLDDHLHRVAVPTPGGRAELAAVVAGILGRPLRRDRPLWELHLVEGLEDGTVALVAKMHHAVADGIVGAELLLRLFDTEPETEPGPPPPPGPAPWAPGPLPAPAELLRA
ncbi:MAG: wax ester/triacylglycerol synthase family O-acyltransferase, partial [Actinomycetota bacterium]|nr:wax ester/triacylglycerol synthase family O-acyltransferase [Actinomycetota bacterium]